MANFLWSNLPTTFQNQTICWSVCWYPLYNVFYFQSFISITCGPFNNISISCGSKTDRNCAGTTRYIPSVSFFMYFWMLLQQYNWTLWLGVRSTSSICIGICFCRLLILSSRFLLSLRFMLFCLNACVIRRMLNIGSQHLIRLKYFSIPCTTIFKILVHLDRNCRHHATLQSAGISVGILYDSSNN